MKRTAPLQQKNELGQRLCRVPACGKLVGKGRRSYCSTECARAFEVAYFPASTRRAVFKRDHGVCALCGCDTEKLRRIFKWMWQHGHAHEASQKTAREMGFSSLFSTGGYWQADHIVECVRGGWGTGLENLRTLCTPCHKAETKRLAAELASERRRAKDVGGLFEKAGAR